MTSTAASGESTATADPPTGMRRLFPRLVADGAVGLVLWLVLAWLASRALSAFVAMLCVAIVLFLVQFELPRGRWQHVLAALALGFALLAAFEVAAVGLSHPPDAPVYDGRYPRFWRSGGALGRVPAVSGRVRARRTVGGRLVYDVSYGLDAHGLRVTRSAPGARCGFAFFGGGRAFGVGLDDVQTLPYQFSRALGYRAGVVNLGFPGYGAQQMLRALEEGLPSRVMRTPVSVAFYVWSPEHAWRAAGWSPEVRDGPRYVLDRHGIPRHAGAQSGPGGALRSPAALREALLGVLRDSRLFDLAFGYPERASRSRRAEAVRLLVAIVAEARRIAASRYHARLEVLGWNDDSALARETLTAFAAAGIDVVDVATLLPDRMGSRYVIPGDGHPNARANAAIGGALARRFGRCAPG